MNARLYDLLLGRFVSPDNFVQGELFRTAFFKGGLDPTSSQARADAWRNFDPTAEWSRTWQLPQQTIGYLGAGAHNLTGGVRSVTYYGGATAVESHSEGWGGISLGNYIVGESGLQADLNNPLFQHEYGHYLQSQEFGLFYLNKVGLPSVFSRRKHGHHPVEQDANARAYNYFTTRYENTSYNFNWYYEKNSILDMSFRIGLRWWDYLTLGFVPGNPLNVIPNTVYFNRNNRNRSSR